MAKYNTWDTVSDNLDPRWNKDNVKFRVVPFGPPVIRDNESHNPGRQLYCSVATRTYLKRESFNFYWIDEQKKISEKSEWQSGPPDNDGLSDYVVDACGYWTSTAGQNTDWDNTAGDPFKLCGFSMVSQNAGVKGLYSVGVGQLSSSNEGMEYGVVGMSGYMRPDWDGKVSVGNTLANLGLRHAYVAYRMDCTQEELQEIEDTIKEIIQGVKVGWEIAKVLFPDYAEGEVEIDRQTKKKGLGCKLNFPEGFDIKSYISSNMALAVEAVFGDGRFQKLKDIKIRHNKSAERVFDAIVEAVNIDVNTKNKQQGAHHFKIQKDSLARELRSRRIMSFMDIINWYVYTQLPDATKEILPNGYDFEKLYYNYDFDVSRNEYLSVQQAVNRGGVPEWNETTGQWVGNAHGVIYDDGEAAFNEAGEAAYNDAERIIPYNQNHNIFYNMGVGNGEPRWEMFQNIHTFDMEKFIPVPDQTPKDIRFEFRTNKLYPYKIYLWWAYDLNAPQTQWVSSGTADNNMVNSDTKWYVSSIKWNGTTRKYRKYLRVGILRTPGADYKATSEKGYIYFKGMGENPNFPGEPDQDGYPPKKNDTT